MGRGCLNGDSAHYLLKNHSFYRRIVFWPCLFRHSPLSPRLENFTAWKRDWLQRPRGERTRVQRVSALRVERKRRWRSRPWRNLVASIAILYLCGRSSWAKFSLSRPTSTKLPSCLSIACRDPA